ncbi:MAG: NUDIX hydrolase [Candidatus Obscuribacterales bacterium]|nr:NUDIX hydrolase [Candidatus Obscuribacterales bacterium]
MSKIVEIGKEEVLERNGAFVAIFCRTIKPYVDYNRPIDCAKEQTFSHVLMQLRWDGAFGFPGGKVDPGETLKQACVREADEEIGAQLTEEQLIHVCSHKEEGGNFAAHLYAVEVDEAGLQEAIRRSWTAKDAIAEACGVIAPRISMYGVNADKGISLFLSRAPMSFSARHEFILVLERLKLLEAAEVELLRARLTL